MPTDETEPAALPEPVAVPWDTAKVVDFEWAPFRRHAPLWDVYRNGSYVPQGARHDLSLQPKERWHRAHHAEMVEEGDGRRSENTPC